MSSNSNLLRMDKTQILNAALVGDSSLVTELFIKVKESLIDEEPEEGFTTVTHNCDPLIHFEARNQVCSINDDMHTTHALSVISTSTESYSYGGYDELKFYQNLNKKFRQNALHNQLSCIYMVVMFSAEVAVSINRMVNSVKNSIGLDSCKSILVVVIESIELNQWAFSDADQRLFKCIDQNQVVCIFISAKNHKQWVKECMEAMNNILENPGEKGIFKKVQTKYVKQLEPYPFQQYHDKSSGQRTNNYIGLGHNNLNGNEPNQNNSFFSSPQKWIKENKICAGVIILIGVVSVGLVIKIYA